MTIREHFDLYSEVEVTEEVRNCLKETRAEHIRCKNRDYQHGVLTYPFGLTYAKKLLTFHRRAGTSTSVFTQAITCLTFEPCFR